MREEANKKAEQILENCKKGGVLSKEKIVSKADQDIRSLILNTAVKSMQSSGNDSSLYDEFLTKTGEAGHGENE